MRRRAASLLFIYFRRKNQLENAILQHCRKKPERSLLDMLSLALAAAHYQDALATESVVNIAVDLCKKLYSQNVDMNGFENEEFAKECYPDPDIHKMFVGEILYVLKKC